MKVKIMTTICIVTLILMAIFNFNLLPLRKEMSDMEIVTVAGLDRTENGYNMSIVKPMKSQNTSKEESSSDSEMQVVSIDGSSYNFDMRYMQTATDKEIMASHIKYYFIGEETARTDLYHTIDAIARGYQTRLNSKIYVVRGSTAKEFLEKAVKSKYNVEDKLKIMESGYWSRRITSDSSLLNIGKILNTPNGQGIIPVVSFKNHNKSLGDKVDEYSISETGEEGDPKIPFDFAGLGLIKNMQLVDFLSQKETVVANYVLYEDSASELQIKDEKKNLLISFGVDELKVDIDFKFDDKDIVNEITFDAIFLANYEEVRAKYPVFTMQNIERYQEQLNSIVKKQIEDIVKIGKEKKVDFLKLEETLEQKHPYNYLKNKEDFEDIFNKAKITVTSVCSVQTTYDIVESNWKQRGD